MDGFEAHRLAFKTTVTTPLRLPPFKGSSLRGAFATTLRQQFCTYLSAKTCQRCHIYNQCPAGYLVATVDSDSPRGADVPRPYVIVPPLDSKTTYNTGDALDFDIIVFGRALAYLPYVVVAVQRMGREGLGSTRQIGSRRMPRGTFTINEIWAVNTIAGMSQRIHSNSDGLVKVPAIPVVHEQVMERCDALLARYSKDITLSLRLVTPLRLIENKQLVRRLTFPVLFLRLIDRLEALTRAYGEQALTLNVPDLLQDARQVLTSNDATQWLELERYSSRQERRLPMGGLIGSVNLAGLMDNCLPWLIWGTEVGLGKYATMGCGRYDLTVVQGG